jgi:hypothetical protein
MVDPLQYLHFIASAYVVVVLLRGHEERLRHPLARPIVRCGTQALSVFLSGILLADLGGLAFDLAGTGLLPQLTINAVGIGTTIAVAYAVAWVKSAPWARPAPHYDLATAPVPVPEPRSQALA